MENKNIILYKPSAKLIKKIDYVAKDKEISRNQLIISTLEKAFLENDLDLVEQKTVEKQSQEIILMVSKLKEKVEENIELQQDVFNIFINS